MRDVQRAQQPAQRGVRLQRLLTRGEALQIEIEPAVRIGGDEPMGHMHGQAGLAHARHAVDRGRAGGAQQLFDQGGLRFPAGEVEQVGRQIVAAPGGRRAASAASAHSARSGRGSRPTARHSATTASHGGTSRPVR
ncbi:hypothetical protein GCM10027612_04850 [Microbispora bryophytorum subsp. camponoti]